MLVIHLNTIGVKSFKYLCFLVVVEFFDGLVMIRSFIEKKTEYEVWYHSTS